MILQFEPYIKKTYARAVAKQIESGWLGPGKTTEVLEKKIAQMMGVKYAMSTTSGTTALIVALEGLRLKKKKVLFPNYTMLAGANAAKFLGYEVVLLDVKEDTMSMNPEELRKNIDEDVGVVIFVDHNGYNGNDLLEIKNICDENKIPLIEDSAQCLGLFNKIVGDVGVISFSVPKIVTSGQGGVVLTNNSFIYEECLKVRDHGDGWRKNKIHNFLGVNFKFNDILASLAMAQLDNFDDIMKRKRNVWKWYREKINIIESNNELTWMVMYRAKNPDVVLSKLKENSIEAVRHYMPVDCNPPYNTSRKFPVSEKIYNDCLYLPSSLTLKRRDVVNICDIILEVERK